MYLSSIGSGVQIKYAIHATPNTKPSITSPIDAAKHTGGRKIKAVNKNKKMVTPQNVNG